MCRLNGPFIRLKLHKSFSVKKACFFLLFVFATALLTAQDDDSAPSYPRIQKTQISSSGCYSYLPAGMPDFELSKSDDGSDVYTSEIPIGEHRFGVIAVKFADPFSDATGEELEDLLVSYLDFLQEQLEIETNAGYGYGHTQEAFPNAKGVIDYWEDATGYQYAIKAWIDKKGLAVLYIGGSDDFPSYNYQQLFLDGFRFCE